MRKNLNFLGIALTVLYSLKSFAVSDDRASIAQLLTEITLGNDGFYNKAISPAKSLNMSLSSSARTQEVNHKVTSEVGNLLMVFKTSTEETKLEKIQKMIASVDPKIATNDGASIQFYAGSPSGATSRVLILIEKNANHPKISAENLLKIFSSYKRSALPNMSIYEYSDARNLNQSQIKAATGNDSTWRLPLAAPSIEKNKDLALKKCRQIFGWKCVTSLYRTGDLKSDEKATQYFYAGIYDLETNSDHPSFLNDKRSFNQITGSTAFYAVTESARWVMLYGIDSQWNTGGLMFTSMIEEEFYKDVNRLKERVAADLQIPRSTVR